VSHSQLGIDGLDLSAAQGIRLPAPSVDRSDARRHFYEAARAIP
jgi:hypothetical protein